MESGGAVLEFEAAKASLQTWLLQAINFAELSPTDLSNRVLVFPGFSDIIVILMEGMVKENCPRLISFYIGNDFSRRLVICQEALVTRKLLQGPMSEGILKVCTEENNTSVPTKGKADAPDLAQPQALEPQPPQLTRERKKKPDMKLYIPISKRKNENNPILEQTSEISPLSLNCNRSEITRSISLPTFDSKDVSEDFRCCNTKPEPCAHWEALDHSQLKELHETIGCAEILKPDLELMDMNILLLLTEKSLSHIIEAYDFQSSFKDEDIRHILHEYTEYNIKWVDDTTALLLFRDITSALQVLSRRYTSLKLRPLAVASLASKNKVKRRGEFYLPYKERPATSVTTARRMISFSLGLNTVTKKTDEENLLNEARALKREARARKS